MTDYEKAKIQIAVALIGTGITERGLLTNMVDDLLYDLMRGGQVVDDNSFKELSPTFASDDIPF